MTLREFAHKLTSRLLWLNLAAMAAVLFAAVVAVHIWLNVYTHHGEAIPLPDLRRHSQESAEDKLAALGMIAEVVDTGYVKNLPPGTVLHMIPEPGTKVKSGRTVYLTVNAGDSPLIAMPDLADNSSLREATARLSAMGFKVGPPQYVPGEKDWVYGILVDGRSVSAGQRVPADGAVTIQAGNGQRSEEDTVFATDANGDTAEDPFGGVYDQGTHGDADNFEVVE